MFSGQGQGGFIESQSNVIKIGNISYPIFTQIMSYLYSGSFHLGPQIQGCLDMHNAEMEKYNERSVIESAGNAKVAASEKLDF